MYMFMLQENHYSSHEILFLYQQSALTNHSSICHSKCFAFYDHVGMQKLLIQRSSFLSP